MKIFYYIIAAIGFVCGAIILMLTFSQLTRIIYESF